MWFHRVADLIRENCLAPYSFPIYSADAVSLKAMATRASRFLFALQTRRFPGTTHKIPAHALSSKSLDYINDDGFKNPPQLHQVLPGGRWLLTANSSDDTSHVCCWDLHQLTRSPVVHCFRKSLAIFDGLDGNESALICQASPEDCSVILMVRTCSADGE